MSGAIVGDGFLLTLPGTLGAVRGDEDPFGSERIVAAVGVFSGNEMHEIGDLEVTIYDFGLVASSTMECAVIDHALVREKVGVLRASGTGMELFRRTLGELSLLVGCEALRGVAEAEVMVETPMVAECRGSRLAKPVVIVPILRAGLGMADALSAVLPGARIGHIGVARNETTLEPEPYYLRMPPGIERATVLVVDPMLATGNSAVYAIEQLKAAGCRELRLVCLIGAPEGVERVSAAHPDVPVFLAALDEGLDERGYIVPGLGDAGDRYFGT